MSVKICIHIYGRLRRCAARRTSCSRRETTTVLNGKSLVFVRVRACVRDSHMPHTLSINLPMWVCGFGCGVGVGVSRSRKALAKHTKP